ncbi:hypothetical protein AgCh_007343 [Apium graveolens]
MGFRDFRDFNLAMLGKQGWRFIKNPQSLVSKVFKARYFPDCSFMDAQIGNNPSFIWRSIWETKHVIAASMRWKIGSGNFVNVIGQPWLLDENNPFVTSTIQGLQNHKVSALMSMDHKGWDEEILCDMFNTRDQQCIRRINLLESSEEDKLYWAKEVSGHYSVRSSYRLLQQQKNLWRQDDQNSTWRKTWRVKVPPKILNFMWRALSNCLPTMMMLMQKHVPLNVGNDCYLRSLQTGIIVFSMVAESSEGDGKELWVAPQIEYMKISADATIFSKYNASGLALIARDDHGDLVQARTRYLPGMVSSIMAEVLAIKEALSWIKSNGWSKVVVESDCLTAIQAIRSKTPMVSPLGQVVQSCRNMLVESNTVSLFFVKRSANMAAHELARLSCSFPDRVFDRSSIPTEVQKWFEFSWAMYGDECSVVTSNCVIDMYGKCGCVEEAIRLFEEMNSKSINPRPIDDSILHLQPNHRSEEIWRLGGDDAMRCRHLNPDKETIRLDRRMIPFLQSSGFYGVARLSALQLDWSLLSVISRELTMRFTEGG